MSDGMTKARQRYAAHFRAMGVPKEVAASEAAYRRHEMVKSLARLGLSNADIGRATGFTRERVRQVLLSRKCARPSPLQFWLRTSGGIRREEAMYVLAVLNVFLRQGQTHDLSTP